MTRARPHRRSAYGVLKGGYHAVVPQRWRERLYSSLPGPVLNARNTAIRRLQTRAGHDEIYDRSYYTGLVDPVMERSAGPMVASIQTRWSPGSVFDVGCGTGRLLAEFRDRGVTGTGVDLSEAALDLCRRRGLDVERFDLETQRPRPEWHADVAISTEVAEHLPPECSDSLVDLLVGLSDRVVLTAAQPGGAFGDDHVNEQPPEYWIAKFASRGFHHLDEVVAGWRAEWSDAGVEGCFISGLLVFERDRPAEASAQS